MFGITLDYKNLFVADIKNKSDLPIKILLSNNPNILVNNTIISPFMIDVDNSCPIRVTGDNHIKRLSYYVNCFGFPKKKLVKPELDKQKLVVEEVKRLRKQRKI